MKQDELFRLGKIVRTFGSQGEVVFQIESEIFDQIKKLESVFLNLNENLIPFFIERLERRSKNQALVKFMDINDSGESTKLAGCDFYIPVSILPKQKKAQINSIEIEGFKVIDLHHGETGIVKTILELPQQFLLAIEYNDKEILVPIVDEIVKKIDFKKKTIHIEAPEGLIELYL